MKHTKEVVWDQGDSSHIRCGSTLPWLDTRFGFLQEWKMKCNKIKWFTIIENHSVVLLKVRDVNKLIGM